MNPLPNREVALFSAALELDASQRDAYLDKACTDDPALRQRLEGLLRVHDEAITFLENPAPRAQESPIGDEVPDATAGRSSSPAEKTGDRIGRYKLLQQIGEGGCGVVYMAEQEEPVRRRVALKVIKLSFECNENQFLHSNESANRNCKQRGIGQSLLLRPVEQRQTE